jgi:HSP20 family protein
MPGPEQLTDLPGPPQEGRPMRPAGGEQAGQAGSPPGHVLQTSHEQEAAMTVIRFDPFRDPLERLLSMAATGTRAPLGMPMDVYRAGDGSYHVEADLPGVDPDSVEVTVEHSTLTIRAERTPHYGESEQVIVAERPQGSFTRQLSLGEGVDSENLTADYADGVLHLTIPVSPRTQARRVEITHAPGGSRTISGSTAEPGGAPARGTGGG